MKTKFKNIFSSKVWLSILTSICIIFIGLTFFTDMLTAPMQSLSSKVVIPLQKGVNGIGLWLTEKSELLNSLEALQAENKELQEQIEQLNNEKLLNMKEQIELEQLRELYALDSTYSDYEKIGANVIARGSNNWYSTFTIDKVMITSSNVKIGAIGDVVYNRKEQKPVPEITFADETNTAGTIKEGGMAVSVGRLREDTQYDYKFVCMSHNTLRGAAGGAVLLAELLCAEGYMD